MSTNARCALAAIVWLLALGIAGTDDYAEAKSHEKFRCERNPAPEWCPK